jgi:phage terminase large subunit-like protein
MDLSSTTDLTAIVAVFPDEDGFTVLPHFFVPHDRMRERATRDRVPYEEWARRGVLTATTAHPTVDYDVVRATLQGWAAEFKVEMLGFDPWNATDLQKRLEQDGLVCVPVRQSFAGLSAPTKSLEKAILARQLRHDGHPVLRWCVSNVAVESDPAGNMKPSKVKSTEKIDGVVALIMAVDLVDRHARTATPRYDMQIV